MGAVTLGIAKKYSVISPDGVNGYSGFVREHLWLSNLFFLQETK